MTPWTVPCQALLSSTISQSLLKFMSIESMMLSNHFTLSPFSCYQSFPALGSFLMSQLFTSGSQNVRASASASVLPVSIQGWFPLRLISLLSKGLSTVFSSTTIRKQLWSQKFFPSLLGLNCFQLEIICMPKRHILGGQILSPYNIHVTNYWLHYPLQWVILNMVKLTN